MSRLGDGAAVAPEGSANEAADVGAGSFGETTGPSAAAEGALCEGASPSKPRKDRWGRPWSEGSPEAYPVGRSIRVALHFGCKSCALRACKSLFVGVSFKHFVSSLSRDIVKPSELNAA